MAQTSDDILIPKYGQSATRLETAASTNGRYRQVIADMTNGLTAVLGKGKRMTFAAWVYCRVSGRVTLQITDDAGTTTGSTHNGNGWQLLTVTRNISATNATTLDVELDVSSSTAAVTCWINNAWFYIGDAERVTDVYPLSSAMRVRRDDTTQVVVLPYRPHSRHQLRLIGTDVLTSFGASTSTSVATPMAASIEVDVAAAELLYAEAAELLFAWDGLKAESPGRIQTRIGYARMRRSELRNTWPYEVPEGRIQGPFD